MDSQITRQHDVNHVDSPSVVEGENDHHGGKKSVLKMVKAKAKKIKDTLKIHGHGRDHDHDNNQHDQSHDEEECEDVDEDEEMVEDPGASTTYGTAPATSAVEGQKRGVNLEKPTVVAGDRYDSKYTDPPKRPFAQWQDENDRKPDNDLGRTTAMGVTEPLKESRHVSFSGGGGDMGQPKTNTETVPSMEEDPHAPTDGPGLSNYQTKVTDPTGAGGEEAGITDQIPHSFDKLNVYDEPKSKLKAEGKPKLFAGSHDQFSPEPIPPHTTIDSNDPGSVLKSFDPNKRQDRPRDTVTNQPSNQGGYTEKISYATPAIADKAVAAKNVVASKLGYGGNEGPTAEPKSTDPTGAGMTDKLEEDPQVPNNRPELSNYQTKVTDPTGAGGEEAGITQILQSFHKMNVCDEPESKSKTEGEPKLFTGSHDQFSPEPVPHHTTINHDDPGSVLKSFGPNKHEDLPRDTVTNQPSNQGGYTEKISYATSAIAGKAIAAKNVVSSKLGYGGNEGPAAEPKSTQRGEEISKPGPTAGYGNNMVATVTDKQAPVHETVPNVGSSVVSKVRGTGTEQEREYAVEDKGVSAKEYLAEKLRPSDEDKATSEVISDTLQKRKLEMAEEKPVGKVTESEEVRKRLGSDEDSNREMTETETRVAANVSETGKTMVESLKGAVTSWFSPGGGQKQTSEPSPSPGTTHGEEQLSGFPGEEVADHGQDGVGERRIQGSSN